MYLLRLTVSKDAAVYQENLKNRLLAVCPDVDINGHKVPTDAIRCALAYRLREFQNFEVRDATCKAIAASPRDVGRGKLHIEINVQERRRAVHDQSKDGVNYTGRVCTITWSEEKGIEWTPGLDYERYTALVYALDIDSLESYGKSMYFEPDLRRIFSALTDGYTLKFWKGGTYVCLTDSAYQHIQAIAAEFQNLTAGSVRLRTITIDNSRENKESVASELGEEVFTAAFEKLTERVRKPGPNIERLEAEYTTLLKQLSDVEEWLGCTVPCQEAQETFELALCEIASK